MSTTSYDVIGKLWSRAQSHLSDDDLVYLAEVSTGAVNMARDMAVLCEALAVLANDGSADAPGAAREALGELGSPIGAVMNLLSAQCDTVAAVAETGLNALSLLAERARGDSGQEDA